MTQLEKFKETVGILVNAYLNDELRHGLCHACVVGNLVAHHKGVKPSFADCTTSFDDGSHPLWQSLFATMHGKQTIKKECLEDKRIMAEINSTGYNWHDLARIELAFETAPTSGDYMFNGLMAVVEVLAEIHNVDLSVKESAKLLFV